MTLAVVAWGYLAFAAIDFGIDARDGDPGAWKYLALASLGAVACLFLGLMLLARLLALLGVGAPPTPPGPPAPPPVPRTAGGRRAAR